MGILSHEQIADFERDGFLVVRNMFDEAEMREIAAWTDEMHQRPEAPGQYMKYFEESAFDSGQRILNRLENFEPYHEGFSRLFASERIQGSAGQLMGEPAVMFKEKINFKLPGGGGFDPHQDQQAGWGVYADFFISVLVSIDEATEENGCLELVSGHHGRGLVGDEWTPLSDEQIAEMDFKPHPTKPGDVVFFDCFAPHGSAPNRSDKPRRALYVTYNRASAGDHRAQYYADKRKSYPPDIEREPGKDYRYRV
jgi:ectoine hydroxylase-related dioxygenase (phytanoyl-CoA dioxygenase family)